MSTEQNKAVVNRFITAGLAGFNVDAIEELLAPNYVNHSMPGGLAGFKAAMPGMRNLIPEMHFDDLNLIAEGDAVVARYSMRMTLINGKKLSARGLTYYRLENSKIVEDDPISKPDLQAELMPLMTPPGGH